ncbi:MAG: hypothetical protein KDK41_06775 [Leptospiraceae bacterium]|nr:hypothetical protein [Leptospiraceae bacterium]
MSRNLYAILVSFAFLTGHCKTTGPAQPDASTAGQGMTTATGVGTIVNSEIGKAKDDALMDAKRAAVAQVLGSLIRGRAEVLDGESLGVYVRQDTDGYIENYTILSQKAVSEIEYQVTIQAKVSEAKLEDAILRAVENQGRPRLLFALKETFDGKAVTAAYAQTELEKIFSAKGFPVVDAAETNRILQKESRLLSSAIAGDASSAANLAQGTGAEFILIGESQLMNNGKIQSSSLNSIQSSLNIRVIEVSTGRVLTSSRESGASAHIQPEVGAGRAAKISGDKVANSIINDIMKQWQTAKANQISVTINGLDFEGIKKIREHFLTLRGVKNVNRKSISGQVAQLEIEFEGNADVLADRLLDKPGGFQVSVKENKRNYLFLEIK